MAMNKRGVLIKILLPTLILLSFSSFAGKDGKPPKKSKLPTISEEDSEARERRAINAWCRTMGTRMHERELARSRAEAEARETEARERAASTTTPISDGMIGLQTIYTGHPLLLQILLRAGGLAPLLLRDKRMGDKR